MNYRHHHGHQHGYHGNVDAVGCLIGLFLTFIITVISIIVELFMSGNRVAKGVAWGIIALLVIVYYLIKGGFSTTALIVFGVGTIVVMVILSMIPVDEKQSYVRDTTYDNEFYNRYNSEEDFFIDGNHMCYEPSFDDCFGELESNVEAFLDDIDSVDDFTDVNDFDL